MKTAVKPLIFLNNTGMKFQDLQKAILKSKKFNAFSSSQEFIQFIIKKFQTKRFAVSKERGFWQHLDL